MRYVPVKHLRSGHKLASDLVLSRNRILLRKGRVLSDSLIKKIEGLGYQGLYIDDEISKGLFVNDVVSAELKMTMKNELQSLLDSTSTNRPNSLRLHMKTIDKLLHYTIDEMMHSSQIMVNMIDLRTYDDYTYSHSLNVAILSVVVGITLGYNKNQLHQLAVGALLHDTGKMFIDKEILNKPARLTPDEFDEIKKHSERGYNYLCDYLDIPEESKIMALQHHEQFGGNGYPYGLSGDDIHSFGRIVGVVDVFDALTADRPYRKAMLPSDALEYIMGGYNTMFDPNVVSALTKKIAPYPIGTCIRLSTEEVGIVVKNYENASLRPVVKLLIDGKPTEKYIDLAHDRTALNVTIKEIVNY